MGMMATAAEYETSRVPPTMLWWHGLNPFQIDKTVSQTPGTCGEKTCVVGTCKLFSRFKGRSAGGQVTCDTTDHKCYCAPGDISVGTMCVKPPGKTCSKMPVGVGQITDICGTGVHNGGLISLKCTLQQHAV